MLWGSFTSFLLLLGAVPAILFLHSLRPRGIKVRTTALFLLERVLKEQPVGKRLGWLLRKNLLLILQLIAAFFLVTALADPSVLFWGGAEANLVAVVDLSASMKAKDPSGSRFEKARRELLSAIEGMSSGQQMMLIAAGPSPRVVSSFTSDKRRLEQIVHGLEPADAEAPVKEAVLFAHSFLRGAADDQVIVFSDGAFEGAQELPWNSTPLRMVQVSGGKDNVGIVGFEMRRLPAAHDEYEILVGVRNFTDEKVRVPLALGMGQKPWIDETVEIEPQTRKDSTYSYRGPLARRATASLKISDDFSPDNQAFLSLTDSSPLRVLYAGKGNFFLERLFESLPNVSLTATETFNQETLAAQKARYDLIILDGVSAPRLSEGNFLLMNTVAEGVSLRTAGRTAALRAFSAPGKHPVTAGVRLDDILVKDALVLHQTGPGTVLLSSNRTPLIFAHEKERLKALVFGFDLLNSDLPYRVAFPVLMSNALDWFQPRKLEFPTHQVQAGRPYRIQLRGGEDDVEVRTPSNKRERLRPVANPLPYSGTFEAGFYSFKAGNRESEFAVNLLSQSESDIRPRVDVSKLERRDERGTGRSEARGYSLWPWLLLAVVALLGLEGFLAFRGGSALSPLLFRAVTLATIVLALSNPTIFKPTDALDVVLAADRSLSVGQRAREKAMEILDQTRELRSPETRTGLLSFAKRPVWEFAPRTEPLLSDSPLQEGRGETDIQAALQSAVGQTKEGSQTRVLLISDGNENRGEALKLMPLLRSQGVQVWTYPLALSTGDNEVYISDLILPTQVESGQAFEITARVESLGESPAQLRLLRNGLMLSEQETRLAPGSNPFAFKQALIEPGVYKYEFLVESPGDGHPENNILNGVVEVKGPPKVLYLHSDEEARPLFSRALAAQGYSVIASRAEDASLSLAELSGFDFLVLDNVPAYKLSQGKMETIERYVRDLGGGLIVVGGPNSYGAGGYFRTPLERILPLEMRPPGRVDLPQIALLFVLDKSGSMGSGAEGSTKLDLAKTATLAAADLLNPADQIGVLAFDADWEWLLNFRQVGKGEWISDSLSSLRSDGGTDLYKAMVEAHRAFAEKKAAIKHALILSDGLTDKMDFAALVKRMTKDGITVSTVSVGKDSDMGLMREIAKLGKGRAYVTFDPASVPHIFTTEALLISRDLIVEKRVEPKMTRSSGPLKGLARDKLPLLGGYVLTHPKAHADLLMKAGEDPLLASWRYGLGTAAAFTSDLSGRWGRDWVRWEEFPKWAAQLARSVSRRILDHRVRAELSRDGDEMKAVLDFISRDGRFVNQLELRGVMIGEDKTRREGLFHQTAPGRYQTQFSGLERGTYILSVHDVKNQDDSAVAFAQPFISPYPQEYRDIKPNTALLSRLAEETGGKMIDPGRPQEDLKRLFTPDPNKGRAAQETWWGLSGLSLLLLLADLAVRRWPRKT
jgi:Mg-chelatase subunit ChlD